LICNIKRIVLNTYNIILCRCLLIWYISYYVMLYTYMALPYILQGDNDSFIIVFPLSRYRLRVSYFHFLGFEMTNGLFFANTNIIIYYSKRRTIALFVVFSPPPPPPSQGTHTPFRLRGNWTYDIIYSFV